MIRLPDFTLSPDEQLRLHHLVNAIAPAAKMAQGTYNPRATAMLALGLAAEQILWEQNLRLVMHIAVPIARRREQDVEDLFQEGCIMLRTAIRRFDPNLGYKFITYAHRLIHRHLQFTDTHTSYFADTRYFHLIRAKMHRGDAVSERTRKLAMVRRTSLEFVVNATDHADPFAAIDDANVDLLTPLRGNLRELVEMRFGFQGRVWSQAELSEHFQVSRSTISRWEAEALKQLKPHIRAQQTATVQGTAAVAQDGDSISDRWRRRHPPLSLSALPSP